MGGFDEGQQFRQHPRRQSPDLEFVVCIWDFCAGPPCAYSNTAIITSYCTSAPPVNYFPRSAVLKLCRRKLRRKASWRNALGVMNISDGPPDSSKRPPGLIIRGAVATRLLRPADSEDRRYDSAYLVSGPSGPSCGDGPCAPVGQGCCIPSCKTGSAAHTHAARFDCEVISELRREMELTVTSRACMHARLVFLRF